MGDSLVQIKSGDGTVTTVTATEAIAAMDTTFANISNANTERSTNIHDHFPRNPSFGPERPKQTEALDAIQDAFAVQKKKFVILEAPTGAGKSGIGMAAASWAKTLPVINPETQRGAYIMSPQKVLTKQYMRDFEINGLVELKGRANYPCDTFDTDCEAGALLCGGDADMCPSCPYKTAKAIFMERLVGTENFDYYLNESIYAGQLPNRTMLICDEGHNLEQKILGFTDTELTQKKCDEYGVKEKLPIFKPNHTQEIVEWLSNVFMPAASRYRMLLDEQLADAKEEGNIEKRAEVAKKLNGVKQFLVRVNRFLSTTTPDEWFAYSDWNPDKKYNKGTGNLIIKPLTARLFANDLMFKNAQHILIMSATILDFNTFMRNLGIDPKDAVCIRMDSEFPIENRPIFYLPVGNMGYRTKQATLPKMAAFIGKLLAKYAKVKGLVHTQSFDNNEYFINFLTEFQDRILTHKSTFKGSREKCVEEHSSTSEPTVLFSPSMAEGLDLKDDLARFDIITKVPYPALDPYVKARLDRDPKWYAWMTALVMVQQTGRTNRHRNDRSHHYILDEGFADFFNRNREMFPKWWTDSIIWPGDEQ
jgi:Rad3-related DNA helicase